MFSLVLNILLVSVVADITNQRRGREVFIYDQNDPSSGPKHRLFIWDPAQPYYWTPEEMVFDVPVCLTVYHTLDGQDWHEVGKANLYNWNPGKINVPVSGMCEDISQALLKSCKEDGLIHFKMTITTAVAKEMEFLSSAKSCAILKSPAVLTLNFDHSGTIMSISISPSVIVGSSDNIIKPTHFNISYIYKHPEAGPMPDTATYINRMDKEREAKERGSTQDNRSFFAKYWMYIVPVVLFVLLSGSANADAPSGR